jgi:hypothetical protein
MLVNGGGSVTLQFSRTPLQATTKTVFVPWNEIVVLDPVIIMPVGGSGSSSSSHHKGLSEEGKKQEGSAEPCLQHDIDLLKPVVMSSWLPGMIGGSPQDTLVFGESQVSEFITALLMRKFLAFLLHWTNQIFPKKALYWVVKYI